MGGGGVLVCVCVCGGGGGGGETDSCTDVQDICQAIHYSLLETGTASPCQTL